MSDLDRHANDSQKARLATLNDSYGVASWHMRGSVLVVVCDDGDEAEIHPDGTSNWRSQSTRSSAAWLSPADGDGES
jgi:hypothetical protein